VNKQKLVIVGGGGMVGATAAYACALRSVVEEPSGGVPLPMAGATASALPASRDGVYRRS